MHLTVNADGTLASVRTEADEPVDAGQVITVLTAGAYYVKVRECEIVHALVTVNDFSVSEDVFIPQVRMQDGGVVVRFVTVNKLYGKKPFSLYVKLDKSILDPELPPLGEVVKVRV